MRRAILRRATSKVAHRSGQPTCAQRYISVSARHGAASNFVMPALSPTMTEGNIASWKIKEGDSFSAGDVLLDIETDKAQMDVEAQEDGVLAKILHQDGTKGVAVGTRIGVFAEQGDDLSTLELPAEPTAATRAPKDDAESKPRKEESHASSPEKSSRPAASSETSNHDVPQKYPLYPSVQMLLHQKGIPLEEASKIKATGPQGRLLKGDVLAHLGHIQEDAPAKLAASISKLQHLDLSNIKITPTKTVDTPKKEQQLPSVAEEIMEPDTEIALPVSLQAVFETKQRIQKTLGVDLPLSTFIARASNFANEELPKTKASPTADELFDAVLGLDAVNPRTSRGDYLPQITALGPTLPGARLVKPLDIIDVLSEKPGTSRKPITPTTAGALNVGAETDNVFSLSVKKGEEKRARVFLERVKNVLEVEPGQLVL